MANVTFLPVAAAANTKIQIAPTKVANTFKVEAYGYELKMVLNTEEQNATLLIRNKEIGKVRQQKSGKFSAVNTKGGQCNDNLADLCEAIKKVLSIQVGTPYLY